MMQTKDLVKTYSQGAAYLRVRRDWCKGCNICVEACPENILKLDDTNRVYVSDISSCIFCGICAERCPDFCFSLSRPEHTNEI
ncbi:MAG: 4Fe-4S binding protein [Balneolaceae bacterium]|jgi:2-oxoglutarate ferredoxin oxidoreductase subunit delta